MPTEQLAATDQLVQAHVDSAIAKQAAAVLAEVGLTVADFVRIGLTYVARDKALPFEPLIPNATTIAAMQDARTGEGETVTLDDLRAAIRAQHQAVRPVQA